LAAIDGSSLDPLHLLRDEEKPSSLIVSSQMSQHYHVDLRCCYYALNRQIYCNNAH